MEWKEKRKEEIDKLFDLIENKFSLKKEALLAKGRKSDLIMARKFFMNILFERFKMDKMTHTDISQLIKRDRTSFIHHRTKHLNEYQNYKTYKENYENFKRDFLFILK